MKRVFLALALALAGCSAEVAEPPRTTLVLAPIESFASVNWTGARDPGDPVVATVEGTPITASMLRRQLERAEPGAEPRKELEKMIELELLARAAFGSGRYNEAVVGERTKKALARRWLETELRDTVGSGSIPDHIVAKAFEDNIGRFDHFELFFIIDVQVHCCREVLPDNCYRDVFEDVEERRRHLKECVQIHEATARQMYDELAKADGVEQLKSNFEAVRRVMPSPELRQTYGSIVALQEYDFQYDVDRSWDDQFVKQKPKYRAIYKEVSEPVKDAWKAADRVTPFLTQPIRSPLGWHIVYVKSVTPEEHLAVSDPKVQTEIRDHYYEDWRRSHYADLMNGLMSTHGVEVFEPRLVPLQNLEK